VAQATNVAGTTPGWGRSDWLGLTVFGAAAVTTVVWFMALGHGLTFYYDEWDFVLAAPSTSYWHQVVQPHNGHPSMVPYTIYWSLLHMVGLRSYWPYQTVLVLLDIGCGGLLFLLLRRKVHALAAGAAGAVLMLLGAAWQDLLWPFQIGFVGSVTGGLGALVLLDRREPKADVGALACLVVAVGSSGVGLAFLAGVAVELLWRRRDWLRLWIPLVPFALFLAWYEAMGDSQVSTISPSNIAKGAAQGTAAAIGAVVGRGTTVGAVLAVILGVLCVIGFVRSPGRGARLAMALTGLVAFWILTDVARGASSGTPSRYLYPAAALVLVGVGELPSLITGAKARHGPASRPSWTRIAGWAIASGVVAYAGLAIWWNAAPLGAGDGALRSVSTSVRAELGAVVLAGRALPADYQPDGTLMPQMTVGPFLRAVKAFGTPADDLGTIEEMSASSLSTIDEMLLKGHPLEVAPTGTPSGRISACTTHAFGSPNDVTFALPANGALVTAPANAYLAVRAAALSKTFSAKPQAIIAPGSTCLVKWSSRPNQITWHIQLTAIPPRPGVSASVCPVT
jgi:hypothetical protein